MSQVFGLGSISAKRYWANRSVRWIVSLGGVGVIAAIILIFGYLLWVVAPVFAPGSINGPTQFEVIERSAVLVDVSENGEIALRIAQPGWLEFYNLEQQRRIAAFSLDMEIIAAQRVYPTVNLYALLDRQQQLFFVQVQYPVSYDQGQREITPTLQFPFGKQPLFLGAVEQFDVQTQAEKLVVAHSSESTLTLSYLQRANASLRQFKMQLLDPPVQLIIGPRNEWLYALSQRGDLEMLDIRSPSNVQRLLHGAIVAPDRQFVSATALLGRYSLMVADSSGVLTQWGVVNTGLGMGLEPIREFKLSAPATQVIAEPRRKGFIAVETEVDTETDAQLRLMYPTSHRDIARRRANITALMPKAISPRADALIVANSAQSIQVYVLDNQHPEISFSALWAKVWYEGYVEPIFSWQSSSADNDFEAKFSLTPLAFGTLKAAFYALLFAVPIAVMGAIYSAYFMAPQMRAWVKPGIEIMAALPTVILGFIGGLWLAPIIETHLSSVLAIFVLLPTSLLLMALGWSRVPQKLSHYFSGWYGLMVVPLIVVTVYLSFDLGPWLERVLFDGDTRSWVRGVLGLEYDQRNALVVGIVMGLAVVPTIYSIAEDAIYAVPQHLTNGSLALGATTWQTLTRVVLLTASPGIFSAIMIGMGRAVGETMIVLMATGNTPLMDVNIFAGMRTFAANIAVELPESAVNSSHYRILFLAALVLFMLTFAFNTFAEVVRQRLRTRYGSL